MCFIAIHQLAVGLYGACLLISEGRQVSLFLVLYGVGVVFGPGIFGFWLVHQWRIGRVSFNTLSTMAFVLTGIWFFFAVTAPSVIPSRKRVQAIRLLHELQAEQGR